MAQIHLFKLNAHKHKFLANSQTEISFLLSALLLPREGGLSNSKDPKIIKNKTYRV